MAKKKGKHSTPDNLDPLFKRGAISEDVYQDFWSEWWRAKSDQQRDRLIDFYITESIEERIDEAIEEGEGVAELPLHGSVTKVRSTAESQAALIGGYVVRRTKNGRFSKHGHYFQAIHKRRKK